MNIHIIVEYKPQKMYIEENRSVYDARRCWPIVRHLCVKEGSWTDRKHCRIDPDSFHASWGTYPFQRWAQIVCCNPCNACINTSAGRTVPYSRYLLAWLQYNSHAQSPQYAVNGGSSECSKAILPVGTRPNSNVGALSAFPWHLRIPTTNLCWMCCRRFPVIVFSFPRMPMWVLPAVWINCWNITCISSSLLHTLQNVFQTGYSSSKLK